MWSSGYIVLCRLHAKTIAETMLYKELLARLGHPLNEAQERWKAERKKNKKMMKASGQRLPQSEVIDSDSDDEENEEQVMIEWHWNGGENPRLQ